MKKILQTIAMVSLSAMVTYGAGMNSAEMFVKQAQSISNAEKYSYIMQASQTHPNKQVQIYAYYKLGVMEYDGKYCLEKKINSARHRFNTIYGINNPESYLAVIKVGAAFYLAMMDLDGSGLPNGQPNFERGYQILDWIVLQPEFARIPAVMKERVQLEQDIRSWVNLD